MPSMPKAKLEMVLNFLRYAHLEAAWDNVIVWQRLRKILFFHGDHVLGSKKMWCIIITMSSNFLFVTTTNIIYKTKYDMYWFVSKLKMDENA